MPARITDFGARQLPFANDVSETRSRKIEFENVEMQFAHRSPVGVPFFVVGERGCVSFRYADFANKRERV